MNNKTVQQYKNISRRSSAYMLFVGANKKVQNEILSKNIINSSNSLVHSSSISKSILYSKNMSESTIKSNISQTKPKINLMKKDSIWKGH